MKFNIAFLSFALLLAACAAPGSAPTYSQAPSPRPQEGVAVLYFYRAYAEPTAWSSTLFIDGKEVVSLPQQGFSWIYLRAGKHTLASRWSPFASVPPIEFTADYAAGGRYFFEITGTSRSTGVSSESGQLMLHSRTTAQLRNPKEAEALQQLAGCCRFIRPANDSF